MMRILIVGNSSKGLYKFRGELVEELIDKGNELYFITPRGNGQYIKFLEKMGAIYKEIDIERRGTNLIKEIGAVAKYFKLIKEIKPDIILTYTIKCNIYASIGAQFLKIPYINTVTGLGQPFVDESYLKKILVFLMRTSFKNSKVVFFQNENDMEFLTSLNVVSQERAILVSGSGVNLERFTPLEKSGENEKLIFLYIGRIVKHKGIEEYLKVAQTIQKEYGDGKIEFQILGSFDNGGYQDIVKKLVEENVVNYLGVSDDVRNEIKEVDCVVNPSYTEGMSNVLLEAAAMGKPLIASDIPGCREIVREYENGFKVVPGDYMDLAEKIRRFIELSDLEKKKMSLGSRRIVVENFDRKIVKEKYIEAIEGVLK